MSFTLLDIVRDRRSVEPLQPICSAGDRYLEIIAPVNEVVGMFNAASDDSTKARAIQALSAVLDVVTDEIDVVDWPDGVEEAVRQLVVAADATSAAATALIAELTDRAAQSFADEVATLTTASTSMRAALGLPAPTA